MNLFHSYLWAAPTSKSKLSTKGVTKKNLVLRPLNDYVSFINTTQTFSAVRVRSTGNRMQHRKSTFLPRYKRGVGCPEGRDLNRAQQWRQDSCFDSSAIYHYYGNW